MIDGADEFLVDAPAVRAFIEQVRAVREAQGNDAEAALRELAPAFSRLLQDEGWLPEEFAEANPAGTMGGGIGQWLLYRAGDGSMSLFSLVIPSWRTTPVHDHLAWGLVGVHRGEQTETVYRRQDDGSREGRADLAVVERRPLRRGDYYVLLPPDGDIHAVTTTSDTTSVSIHLLGNDAGCVWRHAFDPAAGTVREFQSGYANRDCYQH